jgi:carbohydrate-selective porin OprB
MAFTLRLKQCAIGVSCFLIACNWDHIACGEDCGKGLECDVPGYVHTDLELKPKQEQTQFISIDPTYYGEFFTNAKGGKSTNDATQYAGLLDLGVTFDLGQSTPENPSFLFLLIQNTHGRGLTEDFIGDTQVISNIDSFDNVMQIGEYWWESHWLDDQMTLRLGKQDLNSEFQRIDRAEYFIQSTFGLSPSTAFPTYPDQAVGAVVLLRLQDSLKWKLGAWNAFVTEGIWGYSNNDAFLVVSELEYTYSLWEQSLPGTVAIGALYESEGQIDGQSVSAVREYYLQGEQVLYKPHPFDDASTRGLAFFSGYYPRFPGNQPIAKSIGDSAVAGFTYTGLHASREHDVIGVGIAWSELFQGGTNQEMATELFYRAQWSSHLSVQPDIQYISSPSGIYKDAIAVGIRMELRR